MANSICPECGKTLKENTENCPRCGAFVHLRAVGRGGAPAARRPETTVSSAPQADPDPPRPRRRGRPVLVVALTLLLLAVGGGVYLRLAEPFAGPMERLLSRTVVHTPEILPRDSLYRDLDGAVVTLGLSAERVIRALGEPESETEAEDGAVLYRYPPALHLTFQDNELTGMALYSDGWTLEGGLGRGSTGEEVLGALGPPAEATDGRMLYLYARDHNPVTEGAEYTLTFYFDEKITGVEYMVFTLE